MVQGAGAVSSDGDPASADGRSVRRAKNHQAVLDAVIDLFGEDTLQPTPEEVARRSGVSLRSVYRYYSDRADLLQAAIDRHYEQIEPLLEIDQLAEGPLVERVDRFVAARLRLYEAVAPVARGARLAAQQSEAMGDRLELLDRFLRDQMERHFALELDVMPRRDRRAVATAIDTLFQLESVDHLRLARGLSSGQVAETLRISLRRLLGPE